VVVNDLNPDRADRVAQEIIDAGGKALAWDADVANRFQVASMIEAGRDAFGRLAILVNAAGVYKVGPMGTLDEWDWRRVLDVNLTGAFFCSQLLSRVMADEGGGVIVNIASSAAASSLPDGAAYVASKAGVLGLTRQSARELAPLGIRVNALCPAPLSGDDAADAALAEACAGATLFLCSDDARLIVGQSIDIDGGAGLR
jgi:3-oxoacyl-[acyl-carrier protein] reductase